MVVLADTLRAENLGSYGYERETDPGVAALAARRSCSRTCGPRRRAPSHRPTRSSPAETAGVLGPARGHGSGSRRRSPPWRRSSRSAARRRLRSPPRRSSGRPRPGTTPTAASPRVRRLRRELPPEGRRLPNPGRPGVPEHPPGALLRLPPLHGPARSLPAAGEALVGRLREVPGGKEYVAAGEPESDRSSCSSPRTGRRPEVDETDLDHLGALYDDEIAFFDPQLAEVTAELPGDRTLFALVADHGEGFLDHDAIKHCNTLHDHEIRTPLVLRLPDGVAEEARGTRSPAWPRTSTWSPTTWTTWASSRRRARAIRRTGRARAWTARSLRPLDRGGRAGPRAGDRRLGLAAGGQGAGASSSVMDLATKKVELLRPGGRPRRDPRRRRRSPPGGPAPPARTLTWIREVEGWRAPTRPWQGPGSATSACAALGYIK